MTDLGLIFIYGKKDCTACKTALEYFKDKFKDVVIYYTDNMSTLPKEIKRKNAQLLRSTDEDLSYPMIFADGKLYFGFDPSVWED